MGEAKGGGRGSGEMAGAPGAAGGPAGKGGGRVGLSVPQVAGSAVAAVVAAKLASNLGVYGTIAGAGVVSVLGTCGGTLLQHVFQHTGRRVQEAAVQARRDRPAPGATPPRPELPTTPALDRPGYGAPTSYRARGRGWKRPVAGLALAFGLAVGGITAYEGLSGEDLSGSGHGTTVGNAFTGHTSSGTGKDSPAPTRTTPTPRHTTRAPSAGPDHSDDRPTATPTTTPPATPTAPASPTPTAPPTEPTETPDAEPAP